MLRHFIDLENSYIYIIGNKNSWRVSIKSILLDVKQKTYFYLTKECRTEKIGIKPFNHKTKAETCFLFDSKKNRYCLRDIPVSTFNEPSHRYYNIYKNCNDEIFIKNCDYKIINFADVSKSLKQRTTKNLYNKISYTYQNKKFIIFNKVEYLNFNGKNNKGEEYLQPIYGYVPFLKGNKLFISYVVKYLGKDQKSNLEFILKTQMKPHKFILYSSNWIKNIIQKIFFFTSPLIRISSFNKKISITKSKLKFYEKI